MIATVVIAVSAALGGVRGPCQPDYFSTYPGVQVREIVFSEVDLSEQQCRVLGEITKAFLDHLRALNPEWAQRPVDERREKLKEQYYQHAVKAAAVGTEEQADRIGVNLEEVRETLFGGQSHAGSASSPSPSHHPAFLLSHMRVPDRRGHAGRTGKTRGQ